MISLVTIFHKIWILYKIFGQKLLQYNWLCSLMMYITSFWLICFNTWKFIPLNPLHQFHPTPPSSPLTSTSVLFVSINGLFLFCLLSFLGYKYKWDHMVFVFLCLVTLSMTPLSPPMWSQMAQFHSFSFSWLNNILYILPQSHIHLYISWHYAYLGNCG